MTIKEDAIPANLQDDTLHYEQPRPSPTSWPIMKLSDILTPRWCRWQADSPPKFTIWHNILYAIAGGVFSANLYYSHPILEVMARDFHTNESGVANIPTLSQAGQAAGTLLLLPLADFFPRRVFTLIMLTITFIIWIGLCITPHLSIFQALSCLSAMTTGIMQLFLVLVAELSTIENRAFNISIVATGPTMGILLARILSGLVANFTSWRNVYWLSLAMQGTMIALICLFMPNYPASNPKTPKQTIKCFPRHLLSILNLLPRHPILVQTSLLSYLTSFAVASFWTTLTFLLSGSPYNYDTVTIGLFGLIGASTLFLGPLFARYIVQPLRIPLLSAAVGVTFSLVSIALGTFIGTFNVAGPVLKAILLDAGLMILQVSNRMQIHGIEPGAANKVNTAFVVCLYIGSLTGTKAGNDVYAKYGGWLASGGLSLGIMAFSYVVILARGPHEKGWVGWTGGWRRNDSADEKQDDGDSDVEKNGQSEQESTVDEKIMEVGKDGTEKGTVDVVKTATDAPK